MTTKPVKPFATIDQQRLRSIGYYRLSGYRYTYRDIGNLLQANQLDRFVPGRELL